MYTVSSVKEAWELANYMVNGKLERCSLKTERAGYPIYEIVNPSGDYLEDYVCDLGDRLEVNFNNGSTKNIWICDHKEGWSKEDYSAIRQCVNHELARLSKEFSETADSETLKHLISVANLLSRLMEV